jgi:hypothetical protein
VLGSNAVAAAAAVAVGYVVECSSYSSSLPSYLGIGGKFCRLDGLDPAAAAVAAVAAARLSLKLSSVHAIEALCSNAYDVTCRKSGEKGRRGK